MWVVAMFDLPVDTKQAQAGLRRFREIPAPRWLHPHTVLGVRAPRGEQGKRRGPCRADQGNLPPEGEVRIITITDKQFERMNVFWGKIPQQPEKPPCQLEFF